MNRIKIVGANANNLKNINLSIPRNKLTIITGVSGSGKTSIMLNTLYAASQYQYIESISTIHTKKYLSINYKPEVYKVDGLSPAILVEQKFVSHDFHYTLGNITKLNDYLRILYINLGYRYCPYHKDTKLKSYTINQMVSSVLSLPEGKTVMILAPILKTKRLDKSRKILEELIIQGYTQAFIKDKIYNLLDLLKNNFNKKYEIEIIIDHFKISKDVSKRLSESFKNAIRISKGKAIIVNLDNRKSRKLIFSTNLICQICGYSIHTKILRLRLQPELFSFNKEKNNCLDCKGNGIYECFNIKELISNISNNFKDYKNNINFNEKNFYKLNSLYELINHYKLDINIPIKHINLKINKIISFELKKNRNKFLYKNRNNFIKFQYLLKEIIKNLQVLYKKYPIYKIKKKFKKYIINKKCLTCQGTGIKYEDQKLHLEKISLLQILKMNVKDIFYFLRKIQNTFFIRNKFTKELLDIIINKLKLIIDIGLDYLNLSYSLNTLSSGELQRILIVKSINTNLIGLVYLLDEPSKGLHQYNSKKLIKILLNLRNLGNTIVIAEHDKDFILSSDHILDIGPGSGVYGGKIIAKGNKEKIINNPKSIIGQFLKKNKEISTPLKRNKIDHNKVIKLININNKNLKNIKVIIPIGLITCITGLSGSGKSTLIKETLLPIAKQMVKNRKNKLMFSHICKNVKGLENFDKVVDINQKVIGITSKSNVATYIGIFRLISILFSQVKESQYRGYNLNRFNLNIIGGRCENCKGIGYIKLKIFSLYKNITCDECNGKFYNYETLQIKYRNKNIYQVLNMTVTESYKFFNLVPYIKSKLQNLMEIGLSHLKIGQSTKTFSYGETQRIKLAKELSKKNSFRTLYILEEPTIGLHFLDIKKLINSLKKIRNKGNTVIVIEHNIDLIKTSDWIIDLGPNAGSKGGKVIISGTPEEVTKCKLSYTASILRSII